MNTRGTLATVVAVLGLWVPPAAAGDPPVTTPTAQFAPGAVWLDTAGQPINAHGGGILLHDGVYWWYGERRAQHDSEGVAVYSSRDLYHWESGGVVLPPVDGDEHHDLARGCIMERPKVVYNAATAKFVMWFHLELRGQGYHAARAAVAVSETPTGPFRFQRSFRPNDNMSRDMTLFCDDDGAVYHVFSSRDNADLRLVKLSDDALAPTADDQIIIPDKYREAPAMFKRDGRYYLISSACTGWKPNPAELHTAEHIRGPWTSLGNPARGEHHETTFGTQSTFVLPAPGQPGQFVFLADEWHPGNLADSRHVWLPLQWAQGRPWFAWIPTWDLGWFDQHPTAP